MSYMYILWIRGKARCSKLQYKPKAQRWNTKKKKKPNKNVAATNICSLKKKKKLLQLLTYVTYF